MVRHEDVPALLVRGHRRQRQDQRCCMQRIAYLFYRNRGSLDPAPGVLDQPRTRCSPKYIENVLPDLGERNPETITYHELVRPPASRRPRSAGTRTVPLELLWKPSTRAVEGLRFELADLRDIKFYGVRLVSAGAMHAADVGEVPPTCRPARTWSTLVREELFEPPRRAPETDGCHRSGAGRAVMSVA